MRKRIDIRISHTGAKRSNPLRIAGKRRLFHARWWFCGVKWCCVREEWTSGNFAEKRVVFAEANPQFPPGIEEIVCFSDATCTRIIPLCARCWWSATDWHASHLVGVCARALAGCAVARPRSSADGIGESGLRLREVQSRCQMVLCARRVDQRKFCRETCGLRRGQSTVPTRHRRDRVL